MSALNAKHFKDENAARQYLEAIRWPNGPVCPHCGSAEEGHYALQGKSHRPGLWKCKDCREQFSVTVGTVFERSKIPLTQWLMAAYLMCSSKKGISSAQIQRTLGVTYKTAWFLTHRIRLAMDQPAGMFGEGGGTVEVDETYIGKIEGSQTRAQIRADHKAKKRVKQPKKAMVFTLLERNGKVRSRVISGDMFNQVKEGLGLVSPSAHLMTDSAKMYNNVGKAFASHETVNHMAKEYARGNVTTNTVEGFFSVFKRGMKGVYQHCNEKHLHRYLSEFDFRYNNRTALKIDDTQRTVNALAGIEGKRLTYKRPD